MSIAGADDLKFQVRSVGLVPMLHLTPNTDVSELEGAEFLPVSSQTHSTSNLIVVGPQESRSFWISMRIPATASPGARALKNRTLARDGKQKVGLPAQLEISQLVVQSRRDFRSSIGGAARQPGIITHRMFDERWL